MLVESVRTAESRLDKPHPPTPPPGWKGHVTILVPIPRRLTNFPEVVFACAPTAGVPTFVRVFLVFSSPILAAHTWTNYLLLKQ